MNSFDDVKHLRAELTSARVAVRALSVALIGEPMRSDESIHDACDKIHERVVTRITKLELAVARLKGASKAAAETVAILGEKMAALQERKPPSVEAGRPNLGNTPDGNRANVA